MVDKGSKSPERWSGPTWYQAELGTARKKRKRRVLGPWLLRGPGYGPRQLPGTLPSLHLDLAPSGGKAASAMRGSHSRAGREWHWFWGQHGTDFNRE